VREIHVHAASGDQALADGTAALGVDPKAARVEILDSDEHGVTARVWVPDDADETADEGAAEEEQVAPDGATEDGSLATTARDNLATMLELMGVEAAVEVAAETEDEVTLNVVGDELGALVGSFGQTLNAVQFLLTIMVNRGGGRRRRVVVDADGYRERRRQRLEELAREHARRAREERRDVILEGLRAAERRIIHMALQNDPDVVTVSEGDEPHRRLIISPRL